ncbi:AI-2E family transporter [Pseudomonas sp. RP23018S]|uniref:AI-2E family transporter n=1 Tax=Pseudomonas sp. RP23018S TaxID=3096037 RepID=UPI002ACA734E|nr:AI-2E family transporter [Pseudomonas sp. RP23018S]MDZ5602384.1 AI-2E family transporter [Pseudomonas sp. RP23018S]
MNETVLQNKALTVLLAAVTIAFIWILLPYYGAVFWAVVLAIIFTPMQRKMLMRFNKRRNLAAGATLFVCLTIAILPVIVISGLLVQEGASLYQRIQSGNLDIAGYLEHGKNMLPTFAQNGLDRLGVGNLDGLRAKITQFASQGSQYLATQAFSFGQGTFDFIVSFGIMLYILFFFLREGPETARKIRQCVPLPEEQKRRLQLKFNRVVRATVKGNLVVAITQGALGGIIFWILDIPSALVWAVLMAFLSLLPAVGAGIVWGPVAVYFLVTGMFWQGIILTAYGVLVIGLVDNVLRPLLVGKDTKMPDYLILVSTLGGMAVFGLNGFVIGPLIAALFISSWAIFSNNQPKVNLPD